MARAVEKEVIDLYQHARPTVWSYSVADCYCAIGSFIGNLVTVAQWNKCRRGVEVVAPRHLRAGQASPAPLIQLLSSLIAFETTTTKRPRRRRERREERRERKKRETMKATAVATMATLTFGRL